MKISDEAFAVWCGLRNIIIKGKTEYFINYNMIAHEIFDRIVNRYEIEAIKSGYNELVNDGYIKILYNYNKTDSVVDLSQLYYDEKEFFSDLTLEEMHKIMNIDNKCNKYKLLRYFCCQLGSFNRSESMMEYKGKIGGMGLEYFEQLIPINKSTVVSFNKILEENKMLFIIRHKDFYQTKYPDGTSMIREIPNTYSRWADRKLAIQYAETLHGYKYFTYKKNKQTQVANSKRSLGQKLHYFKDYKVQYDDETLKELYKYAKDKNDMLKREYEENQEKGYKPAEPEYIDLSIFADVC